MADNSDQMSFMFKIKIEGGKGHFEFPKQLRQDLYQNFVRIRGLYSEKINHDYVFVFSNLSEHGSHKSVIRNILATFNFPKHKLFQANTSPVKAPINILPSEMTFFISNDSFEKIAGFSGWLITEIIGEKKKNIE